MTKKKHNREGPLSQEYENFVNRVLNKNLPSQLRIVYIHFDIKQNTKDRKKLRDDQVRKKIKNGEEVFPYNFLDISAKAIEKYAAVEP